MNIEHFNQLLSVAQGLSNKLRTLLVLNLTVILAVCAYLWFAQEISWPWILASSVLISIPGLILFPIWFAISDIQDVPETLSQAKQTATLHPGKKTGTLASLWQLGSLAANGLEHYSSFSMLLNPVFLVLAIAAVLVIVFMSIVTVVAGVIVAF